MWFRSMTPDPDGLPCVGRFARALGVRLDIDIQPDAEGLVSPDQGGMSVAPDTLWNLPPYRRPIHMGRGSTGPRGDVVYTIIAKPLDAAHLAVRPDPARPDKHAFVEPALVQRLEVFEGSLASTRPHWQQAWP